MRSHFCRIGKRILHDTVVIRSVKESSIRLRSFHSSILVQTDENTAAFDALYSQFRELGGDADLAELFKVADEAQHVLESIDPRLAFFQRPDATKTSPPSIEHCLNLLDMWATMVQRTPQKDKRIRGLPQRAQFLLERLEEIRPPPTQAYNHVLRAWAYSREHLRGTLANRLFDKIPEPDAESFRLLIHAWTHSNEKRGAWTATHYLMKQQKLGLKPSLDDYHKVFQAWTEAKDKNAPMRAHMLLKLMDADVEEAGFGPDFLCFRAVLASASQRPQLEGLGPVVDETLNRMKEKLITPDDECYKAAIRTWKHVVLNQVGDSTRAAKRCKELLSEMELESKRQRIDIVKTENVNDVMEAIAKSDIPQRVDEVVDMLHEIEDSNRLSPDCRTFEIALNCWGESSLPERLVEAKSILVRFQQSIEKKDDHDSIIKVFDSFIRVCKGMKFEDEESGLKVVREALTAVESLRGGFTIKPSSNTYSLLIECCIDNTKQGNTRSTLVERIFELCRKDGMVDDQIIKTLRQSLSSDTFSNLVTEKSERIEGIRVVPESWTVNALGVGRVVTADGRKATPLSIEGRITVTRTMKDFRMRRLRDHRNRNLLQGGRLKNQEDLSKQLTDL